MLFFEKIDQYLTVKSKMAAVFSIYLHFILQMTHKMTLCVATRNASVRKGNLSVDLQIT